MGHLQPLIDGYARFYKKYFTGGEASVYKDLSQGQSPHTLIIACSDSRVDPAIVFDIDPGELFVIRNVANIVPPYEPDTTSYHGTSAALEFGISILGVKNIVVLGHAQCAGIMAMRNCAETLGKVEENFINTWVQIPLKQLSQETVAAGQHTCEKESVLVSLTNLRSFPWIKDRLNTGELTLHGWYFDLTTGGMQHHDDEKGWCSLLTA